MVDQHEIGLDALPFTNIISDHTFTNYIRSNQTNQSVIQSILPINMLPVLDIFENIDDIYIGNADIDPDLNLRYCTECKYIDQSQVDVITNALSSDSFGVINYNIRSLQRNFDDFLHIFGNVLQFTYIVGLTETWLDERTVGFYNLPEFKGIHKYRTNRRGGGVSLFIRECLQFEPLNKLNILSDCIESLFIKIKKSATKLNRDLIVGVCYRPPAGNKQEFNIKIAEILDCINHDINYVYLLGDFNMNLLDIGHSTDCLNFYNLIQSYLMFPQFNRPTRVTSQTHTLIDNIFTSNTGNTHDNYIIVSDLSDHYPLLTIILMAVTKNQTDLGSYRSISPRNIQRFKDAITTEELLHISDIDCPQLAYTELHNIITESYLKIFPVKLRRKIYFNRLPWLTNDLKQKIKRKNKLFTKYTKHRTQANLDNFKKFKSILNREKRQAKRRYYIELLNLNKDNLRKYWSIINNILGKETDSRYPDHFNTDIAQISEPFEIASHFNSFFTKIGPELDKKIPTNKKHHMDFLKTANNINFFLEPVCVQDIVSVYNTLKSTASGWDMFNKKIIATIFDAILPFMCHIINLSFRTGIVPHELKIAKVTPLYKADNPYLISNYRPISILPILSKIFEKLFHHRLYTFLSEKNIIYDKQFGFRPKHSTESALSSLNNRITTSFEKGEYVLGILLDFKKAFDTVNFDILFNKCRHYGIRGIPLLWIKSYLKHREQFVVFSDTHSSKLPISMGVPQGSILGPLLFLIYINDLPAVPRNLKAVMYADDGNFFLSGRNINSLFNLANADLELINDWLIANRLSLNASKSNYMLFSLHNKLHTNNELTIQNQILERGSSAKFLGYLLDENLSWKNHIVYISKKVSKNTGILYKLRKVGDKDTVLQAYYSFIHPYLTNGLIIWGSAPKTQIDKLFLLQKRAIRIIDNAKKYDHTGPLFIKYNILPLEKLFKFQTIVHMFKVYKGYLPPVITNLFTVRKRSTYRDTRLANIFDIPFTEFSFVQKNIHIRGPALFNKYCNHMNLNCSLNTFKRKIKQVLSIE